MENKKNLLDYDIQDLQTILKELGEQSFRAKQIFKWINSGIENIDEMTNISLNLRERLKSEYCIKTMHIQDKLISKIDKTRKYIMRLNDGNIIESVLMEYSHGYSACVSSQVGCKMGCGFCASTGAGFIRNLTAGEILDQILVMQKDAGVRIGNIVLMGIGEPLDNYENVIKFFKLVNNSEGLNVGYRHISLSTCGLVPQIYKLMEEKIPITLSISLHATDDETRSRIMPVNIRYSIDKLIEACKIYIRETKRRITFEYALIEGVNDTKKHAYDLIKIVRGMLCHVNLIPVNTVENTGLNKSKRHNVENFKDILKKNRIEVTIRRELGSDINAACGQLRRDYINKKNT